ncbi:arylsulfatase [Gaoshiqia sp. Z1-71]|uniref:arylsulfatase n=1 Tax=Gaoshiqia hydrogeniformans TaxID=3290090 RepID=UPI003BF7F95B
MNTKLLLLTGAAAISSVYGCADDGPGKPKNRPNIIFILADDLGYGDLGFNGGQKIKTPNLDRMAGEGIVFTHHYAGSTVCGPSRACLMTGLHTGHAPVRENPDWTKSGNPVDIGLEDVTVADELKRAAYTCGIIGKWGLAENLDEGMPLKQGFDYFYGFATHAAAHHYYPEKIWENDQEIVIEGNVMMDKIGKYADDLFIDKALQFIDRNQDKPFFLYYTPTIPHYELTVPESEKEYYYQQNWPLRKMVPGHYRHDENGYVTYATMVSRLDRNVARILEQLEKLGLDENTLVIFASDNGHEFDDVNNEFLNSNGDFRGKKRDLYEGGIRVPFIARWPGTIQAGTQSSHVSAFWDFLPTACELARLKPSGKTDGISYLPSLLGNDKKQKKHDYLYWEFNENKGPMQALIKGEWKLVHFVGKSYELYNLDSDVSEKNNVLNDFPEVAGQLKSMMLSARTEHPEFPLEPKKK